VILFVEGDSYERGFTLGRQVKESVGFNVENFFIYCADYGISIDKMREKALSYLSQGLLSDSLVSYLEGMSEGAAIPIRDLAAYNIYKDILYPDECTVLIALPDSTKEGKTLMLKNSDKIGSEKLVGPKYHLYKEVNVVVFERTSEGHSFIAVAAAGEASIKMGLNERGLATGSNISRTLELKQRKVDLSGLRALDRGWLMREGISKKATAKEAATLVINHLLETPMSTPGNIEFVDPTEAVIIEGSYDLIATQFSNKGVHARSNRFVVLENLNDPEDVSSYVRYIRAMQLLKSNIGKITSSMMISFSQDHENGPGPNSICRHSPDFREETSLSAAVMEIDKNNPTDSIIHVCLGKPCHAWKAEDGHMSLDFKSVTKNGVPNELAEGTTFKKYYTETPFHS